ncbi:MAG: hypothetical protein SF052_26425 [Bacteroidia bacterium]|nr:hypothetical protein [Bacteroidia bacterium]
MSGYLFTVLISVSFLTMLTGCNGKNKHSLTHPIRKQLVTQMENSCRSGGVSYLKSVINPLNTPQIAEDSLYSPIPEILISSENGKDSLTYLPLRDMGYALDQFYDAPFTRDFLTVSTHNDTLIARIKPGSEKEVSLHLQKIYTNPQGNIEYYEVVTHKKSALYVVSAHTVVFFNPEGLYQNHTLSLFTRVPMIRQEVQAIINGKAEYNE